MSTNTKDIARQSAKEESNLEQDLQIYKTKFPIWFSFQQHPARTLFVWGVDLDICFLQPLPLSSKYFNPGFKRNPQFYSSRPGWSSCPQNYSWFSFAWLGLLPFLPLNWHQWERWMPSWTHFHFPETEGRSTHSTQLSSSRQWGGLPTSCKASVPSFSRVPLPLAFWIYSNQEEVLGLTVLDNFLVEHSRGVWEAFKILAAAWLASLETSLLSLARPPERFSWPQYLYFVIQTFCAFVTVNNWYKVGSWEPVTKMSKSQCSIVHQHLRQKQAGQRQTKAKERKRTPTGKPR